jgi:DNA-binding MarR family transcriptional regulator
MFLMRDLPKYEAIRTRAAQYPEIDPEGLEAFLVLMRVGTDVLMAVEKYLARHKMSQGSFSVLMVLYRNPTMGLNPSDLAARCGVTRATMTGLLDSLQRKKLIRRESNQTDRRTIMVHLNERAVELLESMLHDYYRRIAQMTGTIPATDKKHLSQTLLHLNQGVDHISRL